MPCLSMYKARFKKEVTSTIQPGKKAILLISVGQHYHEGQKLLATINLINKHHLSSCKIIIADTLQRHNHFNYMNKNDAYNYTLKQGKLWLVRNKSILEKLKMPYTVEHWDDTIKHPAYQEEKALLMEYYHFNADLQNAIFQTINSYIMRKQRRDSSLTQLSWRNCFNYIIEECPVIVSLAARDGFDYIIYPNDRTTAMTKAYNYLVSNRYPNKAQWLSLRFKRRANNVLSEKNYHIDSIN